MTDNASTDALAAGCPIVGIGASAGGLEAFEAFFRACPADSGIGFVLVPHLDPSHQSLLTEILQRRTQMEVVQAVDQVMVAANHVYIIPPDREMVLLNGRLRLAAPSLPRGQRMPIDLFLRSLAEDQGARAIGIVLSGTATDGTLGLRAIEGSGGACIVQEPSSAKFAGMPQSAISAGYATHIVAVEAMPALLKELVTSDAYQQMLPAVGSEKSLNDINQILLKLRNVTGHDFSQYKKNTISRRIERRMAQQAITDTASYARFLKDNPVESQNLFKDLLINVTSFFRDPDAFAELKDAVLRPMLIDKPDGYVLRVWVAACASGEEAYSIAIVILELIEEIKCKYNKELAVQIYATDLDDEAIAFARSGIYLPNIVQDVSAERLRRFFVKKDDHFVVGREIRNVIVFAVQSVIKDPPFRRLDLLSCRNLMIYLGPELQSRIIAIFHYSLKPGGVLFLSGSESVTDQPELFLPLDRKWKIYRTINSGKSTGDSTTRYQAWSAQPKYTAPTKREVRSKKVNLDDLARRALLQVYAPASVLTDAKGNILYVYGDTGGYLRPAPGKATLNVIEMAREALQPDVRNIYVDMAKAASPTVDRDVLVKASIGISKLRLSLRRVPDSLAAPGTSSLDELLILSFQDLPEPTAQTELGTIDAKRDEAPKGEGDRRAEQLAIELAYVKANQQSIIHEQRALNEELKSANEELQSTNEELQSSNEELETAKEELQSLNEELATVNSELNAKIEQWSEIRNDLKNSLDSINTGIVFLDRQLAIRRYTPRANKIYRLIPSDVGRPLVDINSMIEGDHLIADVQSVLSSLIPVERELRTIEGEWFLVRMQPYRTTTDTIAGVVLTFTTITDFKLASETAERSESQLDSAEHIAQFGRWNLDLVTGQWHWSGQMLTLMGLPADLALPPAELTAQLVAPAYLQQLKLAQAHASASHRPCESDIGITWSDGSPRTIRLRGVPIVDGNGRVSHVVGVSIDVTVLNGQRTPDGSGLTPGTP